MNDMKNNDNKKLNMGCLSVFFTGLKGFIMIAALIIFLFLIVVVGITVFFWYMNFLLSSPMWLTLVGIAIPIIFFIGYYTRLFQWTVIKAEEYEKENK